MAPDWHERITVDPDMHDGRATIRGMRITVQDVPFNSNRDYNVTFRDESGNRSDAQLLALDGRAA